MPWCITSTVRGLCQGQNKALPYSSQELPDAWRSENFLNAQAGSPQAMCFTMMRHRGHILVRSPSFGVTSCRGRHMSCGLTNVNSMMCRSNRQVTPDAEKPWPQTPSVELEVNMLQLLATLNYWV